MIWFLYFKFVGLSQSTVICMLVMTNMYSFFRLTLNSRPTSNTVPKPGGWVGLCVHVSVHLTQTEKEKNKRIKALFRGKIWKSGVTAVAQND